MRVRLVNAQELAQVEFCRTLEPAARDRSMCKLYLEMPTQKINSTVCGAYYLGFEYFNRSILSTEILFCWTWTANDWFGLSLFFQFTYNWSGYPQSASTVDVLQIVDHSSLGVVYGQRKAH